MEIHRVRTNDRGYNKAHAWNRWYMDDRGCIQHRKDRVQS